MGWLVENVVNRTFLDHAAAVHNNDLITHLCHDTEIMGDEKDRGSDFFFQLVHQVEDLCLNRYIQSCSRLIGNQDFRVAHQSHGDHDTLALSAGKLERILLHHLLHARKSGHAQHLDGFLLSLFLADFLVHEDGFHDLVADLHNRV